MSSPLNDPKNKAAIEAFLVEHAPLINLHVKKLRNETHGGLSHIEDGDLHVAGMRGLMEAVNNYNPELGSFKNYAQHKISGRMKSLVTEKGEVKPHLLARAKRLAAMNPGGQGSSGSGQDPAQ